MNVCIYIQKQFVRLASTGGDWKYLVSLASVTRGFLTSGPYALPAPRPAQRT